MWFTDLAAVEDPGRVELQRFVEATRDFLAFALEADELRFLWEDAEELAASVLETFNTDAQQSAEDLLVSIPLRRPTLVPHKDH
jgi:hypothetical protein